MRTVYVEGVARLSDEHYARLLSYCRDLVQTPGQRLYVFAPQREAVFVPAIHIPLHGPPLDPSHLPEDE